MFKLIGILGAIIVVLLVGFLFMMSRGPNLKEFEHLKEPRINVKSPQKMIVVKATGDPKTAGKKAFKKLFGLYYKLKGVKKSKPVAPIARWPKSFDTPRDEWIGIYAMPIPESVKNLPEQKQQDELEVEIQIWQYGEVAEILHIGSYSSETPTIERLYKFVEQSGYIIAGDHEEEYLKGPGMFFKGNPDKYYTIIRYNIKKK